MVVSQYISVAERTTGKTKVKREKVGPGPSPRGGGVGTQPPPVVPGAMRDQDTATPGSGSAVGSPAIKLDGPNLPAGGSGGIKEEQNIKQEVEDSGGNGQQQNGQNTDTSSAGKAKENNWNTGIIL